MFALLMAIFAYVTHSHNPSPTLLSPVPTVSELKIKSPEVLSATTSTTPVPNSIDPTPTPQAAKSALPTPTEQIKAKQVSVSPTPAPTLKPLPTPQSPTPTSSPIATESAQIASPSATSTPKPSIKPITQKELDDLFTEYSQEYKIDKEQLKRIAKCESGLNPKATNLYYGGLFQFSPASWKGYRAQMGKRTDPDLRFDPEAAINTAAYLISTGRSSAWPNCK